MSDFFSQFQSNLEGIRQEREPEYQRSFIERVFAPFQAPQETLFQFTLEMEDGFQSADLWSAFSHGARYFNPFSDEKPIDPDDVRQVLFGDQADGTLKTVQNLAISLLYDPLLFTGLLKGVGLAGRSGDILAKIANPAELVIDGAKVASQRVVGPLAKTAAYRVLGEERATAWATTIMQNIGKRHFGIDDDLVREVMAKDQAAARWMDEGYRAIKKSQELGGQSAQRLLADALQLDAAYVNATEGAGKLTQRMARDLDALNAKVDKLGIDRDLFWQTWGEFRRIDDEIGQALLNSGAIGEGAFREMRGTHLRRMYQAVERPLDYAKRIEDISDEALAAAGLSRTDHLRTVKGSLYDNLNRFRDELNTTTRVDSQGSMFNLAETFGADEAGNISANAQRYLEDGTGRFNVKAFADDFDEFVTKNSDLSIDEVLAHVNENMLSGIKLPDVFNKSLANYLSQSTEVAWGTQRYADMIRGWANNPGVTFRTFNERLKTVADRSDIPELIREAMGEVLEAAPRLAGEVSDAARTLEMRRFFDRVSGSKRVTEEASELIRQAEKLGFQGDEATNLMRQAADRIGVPLEDLINDVPKFLEDGVGTRVGGKGTRWASTNPNRELGHTVRLPDSEGLGEMAGMWVSPAVATMLRHMEGVDIGNQSAKLWHEFGNLVSKGVGHFKVMKVLLDPTAQVRNFIGNAVLMDLSGTSPFRVDLLRLARNELVDYARSGQPGKYLKLAEDAGVTLFQNTFSAVELKDFARKVAIAPDEVKNWKDAFTMAHATLQRAGLDPVDIAARAFEFNEKWFKSTVFIDRMRRLESAWVKAGKPLTEDVLHGFARQAGSIAEQALFNYSDVPYLVEFARKYGIVPFITFPFKAVPFVAETLYKHPHRVLKYDRIVDVANNALAGTSVDAAREIAALPEHQRDAMVLKMPFNDAHGRPLYLDMSYFMPWAVLQDIVKMGSPSEGGGFREGMLTPPAMALLDALRRNEDSLGRPITDPNRSDVDNWRAVGSFLWKFIAPPSAPGGSRGESIGRAMQAMASTSPEKRDWMDLVGRAWRGAPLFPEASEGFMAGGGRFVPQSQAQLQSDGVLQALGLVQGVALGGMSASDVPQALSQEQTERSINRSEAYRQMAAIRSDPGLTIAEKNNRIRRIMERMRQQQTDSSNRVATLTTR